MLWCMNFVPAAQRLRRKAPLSLSLRPAFTTWQGSKNQQILVCFTNFYICSMKLTLLTSRLLNLGCILHLWQYVRIFNMQSWCYCGCADLQKCTLLSQDRGTNSLELSVSPLPDLGFYNFALSFEYLSRAFFLERPTRSLSSLPSQVGSLQGHFGYGF